LASGFDVVRDPIEGVLEHSFHVLALTRPEATQGGIAVAFCLWRDVPTALIWRDWFVHG
jgi:hypothetical protein